MDDFLPVFPRVSSELPLDTLYHLHVPQMVASILGTPSFYSAHSPGDLVPTCDFTSNLPSPNARAYVLILVPRGGGGQDGGLLVGLLSAQAPEYGPWPQGRRPPP